LLNEAPEADLSDALVLEVPRAAGPPLPYLPRARGWLIVVLVMGLGWSILQVPWSPALVHPGGWLVLFKMVTGILSPDLAPSILRKALSASWITVSYALTGTSLALAVGFPLGILASGTLVTEPRLRRMSMVLGRCVLACMRAIHELVWALLFVVAVGLSPWVAILAIAIPYAGILGRIYADLLNDVPDAPIAALASAGAGKSLQLLYGRLPLALPNMLSYTLYRLECALRSSAVMSFVGLGGLGYWIQLALDDLHFHQVGTYILFLIVLVIAVDTWSGAVRRRLVA